MIDLRLGDCLSILPTLDAGSVDAVVTDVPYGIRYRSRVSSQQGIQHFDELEGDDAPFDVSHLLDFPDVLVWARPQLTLNIPVGVGAWYAWDKVTANDLKVRIGECEYAWHKKATKPRMFRHLWSGAYRDSESGQRSKHPTQKPVKLMLWCFRQLGLKEGDTVLDPYMGSGTTGVACVRAGLNFIGCEIKESYFAIAQKRIAAEQAKMSLFAGLEV